MDSIDKDTSLRMFLGKQSKYEWIKYFAVIYAIHLVIITDLLKKFIYNQFMYQPKPDF